MTFYRFDVLFGVILCLSGRGMAVRQQLPEVVAQDATAALFIEAMAGHENLVPQDVVETTLGGYPALQLDVVSRPGKKCDPKVAYLWELPVVREFHLSRGAIGRIIAADVDDEVVVAVIETPANSGTSPFAFLDTAMELVETIEITPAVPADEGASE